MNIKNIYSIQILLLGFFFISCAPVSQSTFTPPANWETLSMPKKQIIDYLNKNKKNLNQIEGIWLYSEKATFIGPDGRSQTRFWANSYELAIIKKDFSSKKEFNAIIISAMSSHWNYPGRVKAKLRSTAYPNSYSVKWFGGGYQLLAANFVIDENGIVRGMFEQWDGNTKIVSESTMIKEYPSFEDQTTPKPSNEAGSFGSGFLISEKGLVVTNYHVVEDSENIEILFPDANIKKSAFLKIKDSGNDLAILQINNFEFSKISNKQIPYSFAKINEVKVGQKVYTIGYPLGQIMGTKSRLSIGNINSLYGVKEDPRLFQIGNPVQPGNSGGPLFNLKGELVGIVVSSLNAKFFYENLGILPQNVNFAVKVNYLQNIFNMLPESNEIINRKNTISNISMEEQIEKLSPFIVHIKAD